MSEQTHIYGHTHTQAGTVTEKKGEKYQNEGRFHWLDRDPSQPRLETADKHRLRGLKAGEAEICWEVCSSGMSHLRLNLKALES